MYKVCYVTGSRADYSRVRNYLNYLNNDKDINLELLLTGAVLEEEFGDEQKQIVKDGFNISYKVKIDLSSTLNNNIIKDMSIVLNEFGDFFDEHKYDLVILLGDRYEMLSVAIACAMNKLDILHIHGGEITLGNYDEFIRHSITKMSKYHFTSTEEYRNRVIQLGEEPNRVFNVGAMSVENCKNIELKFVDKSVLDLQKEKYFVVLYHPETMTNSNPKEEIGILLKSIDYYKKDYKFVFIGTNADTGSNEVRSEMKKYYKENDNILYYENLNSDSYYYLLKNSIALIGNSSSGIIEAPSLGCYSVNIGDRQKGRVRGESVIDIECEENQIKSAIKKVSLLEKKDEFVNPYYKNNSNKEAYLLTKKILKNNDCSVKRFYDVKK